MNYAYTAHLCPAPMLDVDDAMTAMLERAIQPVAVRAKTGDHEARDHLYASFESKILRFVRRTRVPFAPDCGSGHWDREDVAQEAYLVFITLIDRWPPAIPFGRYFFAHFPWRLRDAVNRQVARRGIPPRSTVVSMDLADWVADHAAREFESRALIEALASSFEPPLDEVLRLHILEGLSLTETADRLGVNRRSVSRYWRVVLMRLRVADAVDDEAVA